MVALLPLAMQAQQSIPYTYGFENNDLAADGWTMSDCHSSTGITTSSKMNGDYGFSFHWNTNPPQYLISPELTGTTSGVEVEFYYKKGGSYAETFMVGYSTTDNSVANFTWGTEITATSDWTLYNYLFPAGTKYIAVAYTANDCYYLYIDDFSFSAPAACPKPTGLAESNVTTTSATLTWDAGTASGWTLEYSTSSDFTDATSETVTGTPSITINTLTAQTRYYVRVKANCGTDGESEWCNAINFTTPCAAFVVDADHDFFEGFEGTTFAPDCWDRIAAGTYNWNRYTYSSYIHQGSGSAYSGYYGDIYLVMPELQIANGTTDVWLKFWSNNSYPGDYDKNSVVLLDGETEIELWTPESVSNSWTEAAVNLSEYKGQTIRLAFKYEGSNAHCWYLDDITVAFDPTCLKPSDVALVDGTLTAHSAKISWTDNTENPLGYILLVNDQEVDADENPFTLDLTPETQYTVRVKAVCTTEDTSDLSTDYATFTTPPTCFAPTAVSVPDSTITTTTAIVYWTDNNENDPANGWTILVNDEEVVADVNPFTLPNLTPSTAYTLKVKANCDTDDESAWSAEVHFATLCDAIVVDEEHDFTEGFEGTTFAPLCWNSIPAGTHAWSRTTSSSYVHEGSAAAYSGYYGDIYLVLPDLQIENGSTNVRLTFWSYNRYTSDYDKNSVILLDGETETELWSPETVEQSWEEVSINLSEYMGQTIRLAFKYEGSNAHAWYVDEVKVAFDPACMRPTALTVDTVTANSVTLTWVDNNEERPASWTVSYENNGTAMETIAYDTTVTIEDLTPETAYTAKVKANCESDWSDAVNFTTLPTCPAPTNLTYSNLTATSVTLDWTVNGEETQWILVLNGQEIEVNTKPLTIDTLTEQTPYTAILRAFCAAYDTSHNSNTARFVTPCTAQTAEGYTEDFSGYTASNSATTFSVMPDCWNYIYTGSSTGARPHVYAGSLSPTANDTSLILTAGNSNYGGYAYAIMPAFDDLTGKQVVFATAMENTNYGVLSFGYVTDVNDASTFTSLETFESNAYNDVNRYTTHEVVVNGVPANARLAFQWHNTYIYYSCCIDDIAIEDMPACVKPINVTAADSTITATSAIIAWTDQNLTAPENGWTININGTDTTVTENPFTFDNLTAETEYTVKVKSVCTDTTDSEWSDEITFTTLPSCIAPSNVEVSAITTTSATISWTDNNETTPEYGWTINLNGVDSTVTENPFTFDNLSASTLYAVKVKANCAADDESAWSAEITFATECGTLTAEGYSEDFSDYNGVAYYSAGEMPICWDYISGNTYKPHVYSGSSYSPTPNNNCIFMSSSTSSGPSYAIMPEFDDLTGMQISFSTAMENATYGQLTFGYMTGTDSSTFTAIQSIPSNAYTATPRLVMHEVVLPDMPAGSRLSFKWDVAASSNWYFCFDDITIETVPTCLKPIAVEVTGIGTNSATISWTDQNETTPLSWTINLNGVDTTVTTNPFTFDNLNSSTSYIVKVKANCTDEDESGWSAETTFSTECGVIVVTDNTPYFESFESENECWDIENGYWTYGTNYTYGSAFDGSSYIYFSGNSFTVYTSKLTSPTFDITGVTEPYISFAHAQAAWDDDQNILRVYYRTSADAEWTLLMEDTTSVTTWKADTIALPNPSATYQIAFEGEAHYGRAIVLDAVNIFNFGEMHCETPTNVAVDSNYVVTWEGEASSYNVIVVVGNDTVVRATSSTHLYTITTGLNEGDQAVVYVQAICDGDILSDWSEGTSFTYGTVGINNYAIHANIYPNPTTGNVTVESNAINADITVYDMFGKLMMTSKVAAERTELNFSSFAPGVYMVRIANSNAITTIKVVKE